MFTIKATYRSETRKFTFPDSSFPTYNQIHEQLFRVFPISSSYFLTRLLFTQSPSAPFARILIGMEARSEEEYEQHVRPFRGREWPDALLRFFWPRPHSPFIAPPPPPLPPPPPPRLPPPPPPPPHMISPFYGPPPPPPPPFHNGTPLIMPPRPIFPPHILPPAPPLPDLPPIQPFSQSESSTVDGDAGETPVQRLFRRRGLRSVSSAPVLGPVLPVPPLPPRPRPVSQFGEAQAQDALSMHQNVRNAYVSDDLDDSHCEEVHASANQSSDKGKQRDACCDVEQSKQEILDLMRVFKADVDRVLSRSLGIEPADVWGASQGEPMEAKDSAERSSPPPPVVHSNIICDLCKDVIIGVRHKCLDCPDFDLCSSCLSVQPSNIGFHSRTHDLFAIEEPGGLWAHAVFIGEDTSEPPTRPANEEPKEHSNSGPVEEQIAPTDNVVVHNATCDLCSSSIKGDRFKCFDCPDFDICSSCYVIVPAQHPGHSFARLRDPTDLKHPSISLPVHRAGCNGCGRVILGVRYKCMHPGCKDFDLCATCEALPIPVHPIAHAMLKIRQPGTYIPVVKRYGIEDGPIPPVASAPSTHVSQEQDVWNGVNDQSSAFANPAIFRDQPAPTEPSTVPDPSSAEHTSTRDDSGSSDGAYGPDPLVRFDEYDTAISTSAPTLATAPTLRPESDSSNSHPSLPHVPPTDFNELFDLASQFRHLLELPPVVTPPSLPVPPKMRHCAPSFVADNNIPDGQIFPPGAEFVKSWRMRNDGPGSWPAETELVFVAGDKLVIDKTERFKVGSVSPGEEVDVWTGEMKAPDISGKYISYWRLCDNKGRRFGHSIWVDICVAEQSKAPTSDDEGSTSLAASSVVMPNSAPSAPSAPIPSHDESTTAPLLSDASSVSLIDMPSDNEDEDNEVYEDSRSHFGSTPANGQLLSPDVDYVVLSDDGSDDI
ncbi:hypothetical protein BJY52DRAFT_1116259 [Lactarius psammicola]|nr:hypothetical protein BJY52DRAFT_1116259 [Lactarius psammicola]